MRKLQNILLYLLFFSVSFGMWDVLESGSLSVVKLIGIFYMGSVILMPKGFFVLPRKLRPIYISLVLYLVFTTIINILNINPVSSRWFNTGMYQWVLMLLILVNHERMRPLSLSRAMLAFAFSAFTIAVLSWFGIGTETETLDGRLTIFGDNPNTTGPLMSIGMAIILYNIIYNPLRMGKARFLMLPMIIPMVILLINTGSRIALLAILGMLFAMVFIIRIRNIIVRVGYVLLIAASISLTLFYLADSDIMSSRMENSIEEGEVAGRDKIWITLIPLISENPIVGVGETGYAQYTKNIYGKKVSPHNVFLELMCYSGVVGTLLYLSFIFLMGRGAFITYRRNRNFLPLLLMIPILGIMMSGQAINVKTTWCLFAYIIGTYISLTSSRAKTVKKRQASNPVNRAALPPNNGE